MCGLCPSRARRQRPAAPSAQPRNLPLSAEQHLRCVDMQGMQGSHPCDLIPLHRLHWRKPGSASQTLQASPSSQDLGGRWAGGQVARTKGACLECAVLGASSGESTCSTCLVSPTITWEPAPPVLPFISGRHWVCNAGRSQPCENHRFKVQSWSSRRASYQDDEANLHGRAAQLKRMQASNASEMNPVERRWGSLPVRCHLPCWRFTAGTACSQFRSFGMSHCSCDDPTDF